VGSCRETVTSTASQAECSARRKLPGAPLNSKDTSRYRHNQTRPGSAILEVADSQQSVKTRSAGIDSMDLLKKLFEQHFRSPATNVSPLQGELGGSGRKIIRLSNASSRAIGILYGVREENAAFLAFSKHFRKHGLPVPEIYG
jgi:hypothetical protein